MRFLSKSATDSSVYIYIHISHLLHFSIFPYKYRPPLSVLAPLVKKKSCIPMTIAEGIDSLPQDLMVELCVHVVSTSPTPRDDIMRLRASCKSFHEASKGRKVGRCMPVRREHRLHWLNKKDYFDFLRSCAECGNLEAYHILGLEEVYHQRRKSLGLRYLHKAMIGGHLVATYSLGVILFQDLETQSLGMKVLNKLVVMDPPGDPASSTIHENSTSGNTLIMMCRREATSILRDITWKRPHLHPTGPSCSDQNCGRIVEKGNVNHWSQEESRKFCSEMCRWMHELHKFFEWI